jgi:hypothetical protein
MPLKPVGWLLSPPTAVQLVAEVQETPLSLVPLTLEVLWMDETAPSHDTAKGSLVSFGAFVEPTATQCLAEVHETPRRNAFVNGSVDPERLAVVCIDQLPVAA